VPAADHVRNDVGAMNERWVAERRGRAGPDVMAEFAEVTAARLDALRAMPAERFEETGPSPVGVVPYREFMVVRVMDCWVHEQDMRVATDRVRRFEGEAATVAMGRIASAMPFVVGKRAGAPEGSSVRIEVGPPTGPIHIEVRDGRARAVGALRGEPTVTVVMDADALWRLGCGRIQGSAARQAGMVTVAGDGALGAAVVDAMAFMI